MGRIRRRRTRGISSPVTDGLVSCFEYAQVVAELSRFSPLSRREIAHRGGRELALQKLPSG
jgi:hypothetical protein